MFSDEDVTVEQKGGGRTAENPPAESGTKRASDPIGEIASSVRELASKIPKAVERALSGRDFPLMVRVNDETLKRVDELVEAGVFKSRSESAAFLIGEGIKVQSALFERINEKIKEIERLRGELKNIVHQEIS